jgi:NAD(P)H dehydrogenase (quinone)
MRKCRNWVKKNIKFAPAAFFLPFGTIQPSLIITHLKTMNAFLCRLSLALLLVFAAATAGAQTNVLISYYSKTGNTQAMAEAVAHGAGQVEDVTVVLKTVEQTTLLDLVDAHAIIVGSPVYNANVAPQVQEFITAWPFEDQPLKNKLGAAFVTAGGISAGEELTLVNILHSMMIFGMIVVGGDDWTAPFGASAIVGEPPFHYEEGIRDEFLEKGEALGRRVAELAVKLNQ